MGPAGGDPVRVYPGLFASLHAGKRSIALDLKSESDRARALGIPGLYFTDTYQRFLPGGPRGAQLIGLTGDEHEGLTGMELQLDDALTGTPGRRVEVHDLFGRPIQVLANREPVPGTDVHLRLLSSKRLNKQGSLLLRYAVDHGTS